MKKSLMGILSFAPVVFFVLTMGLLVGGMIVLETSSEDLGLIMAISGTICSFLLVIVTWVDIIWFIILVFKKKHWATDKKIIWCVVLYCLNMFAFPFFWWLGIVKDNEEEVANVNPYC